MQREGETEESSHESFPLLPSLLWNQTENCTARGITSSLSSFSFACSSPELCRVRLSEQACHGGKPSSQRIKQQSAEGKMEEASIPTQFPDPCQFTWIIGLHSDFLIQILSYPPIFFPWQHSSPSGRFQTRHCLEWDDALSHSLSPSSAVWLSKRDQLDPTVYLFSLNAKQNN